MKTALDSNEKTFAVYMLALEATKDVYPSRAVQIAVLQWDKALTKIPAKYANYADVFLFDLAMELSENTGIKEHAIKPIKS